MNNTEEKPVPADVVQKFYRPSKLVASNPDDDKVLSTAQMLYGEFAGVKDPQLQKQYMVMGASTAQNTFGKGEWAKNTDWDTHLHNRFYAVSNMNEPYRDALQGNFQTPNEQMSWKRAIQVAYGTENGYIPRVQGEFYFTPQEFKKQAGTAALPNPSLLEKVNSVGQYDVYQYKSNNSKSVNLQKKLQDLGYYDGKIDGSVGPMTKSAVRRFQEDNGLKSDGVAGKNTLAKLMAN